MSEENRDLIVLTKETAFKEGTRIPTFGRFKDWGNIEFFKNYIFYKTDVSRIMLKSLDSEQIISLSLEDYRKIVELCDEAVSKISNAEKDSWEEYKAYEELDECLLADKSELRLGIPENFIHNFTVTCSRCKNFSEAMNYANKLRNNLTSFGQRRFKAELKTYKKGQFEKQLLRIYKECSAWNQKNEETENYSNIKLGEKIEKSSYSIGDIVTIAMPVTVFNGKIWITFMSDYKIMQVNKEEKVEKLEIYSDELKCSYFVTFKELKKLIKKTAKQNKYAVELISSQENNSELNSTILDLIENIYTCELAQNSIEDYIRKWCLFIINYRPYYRAVVEKLIEDREKELSKKIRKDFSEKGYDFFKTLLLSAEYTMKRYYGDYKIVTNKNNDENNFPIKTEEKTMTNINENNQIYSENNKQEIDVLTQTIKNLQNQVQVLQTNLSNTQNSKMISNNIKKWEYKFVNIRTDGGIKLNTYGQIVGNKKTLEGNFAATSMTENDWNLLGAEGWEATGNMLTGINGEVQVIMMKRPKQD